MSEAIRFAEAEEIAPRFGRLVEGDIEEKSPGELVTVADRACERVLTALLRDIRDVPVVGEEAAAIDPSLLGLVAAAPAVWLVDPLDGTANFAAGSPDHAVMVAFVELGVATASWIWAPASEQMAVASRGDGASINGVPIRVDDPVERADARGVVKDRFLPDSMKQVVRASEHRFGSFVPGCNCAGIEYPDLVQGRVDFLFYWRTLPWDHAPGALVAEEAGMLAQRPDGSRYVCGSPVDGLLVAHPGVINDIRLGLLGAG